MQANVFFIPAHPDNTSSLSSHAHQQKWPSKKAPAASLLGFPFTPTTITILHVVVGAVVKFGMGCFTSAFTSGYYNLAGTACSQF